MEDMDVTAYLCCIEGLVAIETDLAPPEALGPSSPEIVDGVVSVSIVPEDHGDTFFVEVEIIEEGAGWPPLCRGGEEGSLSYLLFWDTIGINKSEIVSLKNPDICNWVRTSLWGMLHLPWDMAWWVPTSGDGPCPDNKDDAFSGGDRVRTFTTRSLIPGEQLHLVWEFAGYSTPVSVATTFFHTCCYTSGKISAVNGDYGDLDLTYDVRVEGELVECVPSDFFEYAVGDWVFLMKPNDGRSTDCGREESCRGNDFDSDVLGIIIPMTVDDVGAGPLP